MTEKLLLTAAAIRTTNFDVERQAKNIVKAMVDGGQVEVKTPRNWLKGLFVRRDYRLVPTQSEYEAKVEAVINDVLDFEFKKHLAIGERKFRWTEPTKDMDGYLEFFYNAEFQKKTSGKDSIYLSHPYQAEMIGYYDDIGTVPLSDIERYSSSDLYQEVYEKAMPSIIQVFEHCWTNASLRRQNLIALEKAVSEELRSLPWRLESVLLEKVEFHVV